MFSFQAAYVLRLQQQAAQIKKLLKILNNSSQAASLSHLNSKSESSINETGGYESLWEVSEKGPQSEEISTEPSEVDESEDVVIGSDDIYENTGIKSNNFTLPIGKLFKYATFPKIRTSNIN